MRRQQSPHNRPSRISGVSGGGGVSESAGSGELRVCICYEMQEYEIPGFERGFSQAVDGELDLMTPIILRQVVNSLP
jgi:hypothetical protein